MNKSILYSIFLFCIISALAYNLYNIKTKLNNFVELQNSIDTISLINKDFDNYINSTFSYVNFDLLQNKNNIIENELTNINEAIIENNLQKSIFFQEYKDLDVNLNKKINYLQKIQSIRAILNNSFRLIQKIYKDIDNKMYLEIYTKIMTFDKDNEIDHKQLSTKISALTHTTKNEEFFLLHSKTILRYYKQFTILKEYSNNLNSSQNISNFKTHLDNISKEFMNNAQNFILLLFTIMSLLIIIYLFYSFKLSSTNKYLHRFRKAIESSDNMIIVTDNEHKIKYVNDSFVKSTGYEFEKIKGQTPSILRSGKHTDTFYTKLKDTIENGNKWYGEFVNVNAKGETRYEKASIIPIIENDKIVEYVAIKLDITDDILRNKELKEKDELLAQQSKMAAMGEMLENIAHQWRQPLSAICSSASGLLLQKELNVDVTEKEMINTLTNINNSAKYLSETIDSFRNFFRSKSEIQEFCIKDCCEKSITFMSSKLKNRGITNIGEFGNYNIKGIESEFIQVIMNIYSNAMDALEQCENKKYILSKTYTDGDNVYLQIRDNAGGIDKDIIERVFEPYFTTKHQSQGTGIGLYMSREIIIKHLKGNISVKNVEFEIESEKYKGAEFTIMIPQVPKQG